jgi:hypothetical protein
MSDLLQRLIDRSQAPLSALQPMLPSVYAPAENAEVDSGRSAQTDLAESPAPPPSLPPHAAEREPTDAAQPISDGRIDLRARHATPVPPRPDPEAPADAPPTPVRPVQQESSPAQGRKELPLDQGAKISARLPRAVAKPGWAGKPEEKAPITKTFVPRSFASKPAQPDAKRDHSIPKYGRSAFAPDGSGINADLPPAPLKPLGSKATPPIEPATARPVSTAAPIENDPPQKMIESGRSKSLDPLEVISTPAARPAGAKIPARSENSVAGTVTRGSRDPLAARNTETNPSSSAPSPDRASPMEVRVSIGRIEVNAAQPKAPAPRRAPPRPRVTLDEFLKSPHYGGPR